MGIEKIVNGFLDANCYIISNNEKECLVIDPGSEGENIVNFIKKRGYKVLSVLVTHYHFDHIGALDYVKDAFEVQDVFDYKNEGKVRIGNFEFEVIQTFGHTLDSASFYFEKEGALFTGDFVFKETIGNYNKNDEGKMLESLRNFVKMPEDTTIYPGHGDSTNTLYELKNNPYLRGLL